jgi:hypothetical protein
VKKDRAKKELRKKGSRNGSTTVRGIVIPVEWDEDGKALAVAVAASGENDYLIEQDSKGRELFWHIRQEVEIIGIVGKGSKGDQTITVSTYDVIRSND